MEWIAGSSPAMTTDRLPSERLGIHPLPARGERACPGLDPRGRGEGLLGGARSQGPSPDTLIARRSLPALAGRGWGTVGSHLPRSRIVRALHPGYAC